MVGVTLVELRERVESLASDDGSYYVVCGRTGERPVPVAGKRFPDRETAERAAEATAQYRSTLRRYDPRLPAYDLIVCEGTGPLERPDRPAERAADPADWTLSAPVLDDTTLSPRRRRVEFCHRVAAAVFESLSGAGYDTLESAVVDAYLDLAETVADPDDLCLCLLESAAAAFDEHLRPDEQADLLAAAASRLRRTDSPGPPVPSALATLRRRGLVGEFSCAPAAIDRTAGTRSVTVTVSDYALSPRDGRLPVLPLAVELYRRRPDWRLSALRVADDGDGWRITVELGRDSDPARLAAAPIAAPE